MIEAKYATYMCQTWIKPGQVLRCYVRYRYRIVTAGLGRGGGGGKYIREGRFGELQNVYHRVLISVSNISASYQLFRVHTRRPVGWGGGLSILYPKMTTESKGPRTKMLLVHVGARDSSNQPKI